MYELYLKIGRSELPAIDLAIEQRCFGSEYLSAIADEVITSASARETIVMQQEDTATLEVLLKPCLTTVHKLFSETVVTRKEGWSYGTFLEGCFQRKWRTGLKLALLLKWLGQSSLSRYHRGPSPSEVISKANAGSVLRTGTSQRQP